jgi:hypothetical protein
MTNKDVFFPTILSIWLCCTLFVGLFIDINYAHYSNAAWLVFLLIIAIARGSSEKFNDWLESEFNLLKNKNNNDGK